MHMLITRTWFACDLRLKFIQNLVMVAATTESNFLEYIPDLISCAHNKSESCASTG